MSRIVLHIGTEKTGSTAVQQYFGMNRDAFLAQGVLYPRAPANEFHNHIGLAAYAAKDELVDDLRLYLGIEDSASLEQYRRSLEQSLDEEVEGAGNQMDTIVFSNEHCHSRLASEAEIARVAELVRRISDDITVVVYLRRQDRMAVSLYSTYLRSGGTRREVFPQKLDFRYYNFERLLDMWASVFGEEAICPRIYDPIELVRGDIVKDLMTVVGKDMLEGQTTVRPNESFSPIAQEMVRQLNQRVADVNIDTNDLDIDTLIDRLTTAFAGPGRRPSRDEVIAFYDHFREPNEQVRARWFPERKQLFEEDFSAYPETDDLETLDVSDATDRLTAFMNEQTQ